MTELYPTILKYPELGPDIDSTGGWVITRLITAAPPVGDSTMHSNISYVSFSPPAVEERRRRRRRTAAAGSRVRGQQTLRGPENLDGLIQLSFDATFHKRAIGWLQTNPLAPPSRRFAGRGLAFSPRLV